MSKITNIDNLVLHYLMSNYSFKKDYLGHDMLVHNGNKIHINGMEIVKELKLIFDYDYLKSFFLITEWGHKQNRILFDFWKQSQHLYKHLPEYMKKNILQYDFPELYQELFLESVYS